MLQDAGAERQRLTELYGQKWDGELLELAADAGDLTEMAQQVLRDEMRKRGLGVPVPGQPVMQRAVEPGIEEPEFGGEIFRAPATQGEDEGGDTEPAHEYTWKTLLCECETREQVWELMEQLRRAGIESWSQSRGLTYPRVLVAADQLEQAQTIAAQPIPQDIIAEWQAASSAQEEAPEEFELPKCPACGAGDPVLTGVDPSNTWLCEACGKEWRDATDAEPADGN